MILTEFLCLSNSGLSDLRFWLLFSNAGFEITKMINRGKPWFHILVTAESTFIIRDTSHAYQHAIEFDIRQLSVMGAGQDLICCAWRHLLPLDAMHSAAYATAR